MSNSEHHHHHHHRVDSASRWKRKSLRSIELRKKIRKWLLRILVCIAIIMACAVVYLYV